MDKKIEIEIAKKRRAKMLNDFEQSGLNQANYARRCNLTRQRIGKLLNQARTEQERL